MGKFIDRTGLKIANLTFKKYAGKARWLVRCRCGTEKVMLYQPILSGRVKSCGCMLKGTQGRLSTALRWNMEESIDDLLGDFD